MRIQLLSDLHLEFQDLHVDAQDVDVIVLAGDIATKEKGLIWARRSFPNIPVVYVLGNHEYYGATIPKLYRKLRSLARGTNIHVLNNEAVYIKGMRFLGSTLWTDLKGFFPSTPSMPNYRATYNDFNKIRVSSSYRRLKPRDIVQLHIESKKWIKDSLSKAKQDTIIVTHHSPSLRSIAPHKRWDNMNIFYASDLDETVIKSNAKLWLHGHIHTPSNYTLGNTRIVSNPRGYPNEEFPKFIPNFVIEVF